MKYPLQELLRVRLIREDNAQVEVRVCRTAVETASENVKTREHERDDYIAWREQREAELYEEIMEQHVQLRKLDDLKLSISLLREKQNGYEDRVQQAIQELEEAEQQLKAAQDSCALAIKNRQKIDEHKAIWAQEEALRCEAELEKEMEDFRVRKADDADFSFG